jgi:DUF4097 and DUF4098 domain-containing protein YvlB
VDPTGTVRIRNPRGEIEVHGWDKSEVYIEGELDDLAEELRFEVNGKITTIDVVLPTKNVNWGNGSDLQIYIPQTSGLQFDGVATDIEVDDVSGAIMIRTVSGDVDVSSQSSLTQIRTVSGDIDVDDVTGKLTVITTGGDLDLEVNATELFIDTMSGDADIQLGSFDKLTIASVEGSLKIEGELNPMGSIRASTVDSNIDLELSGTVNAKVHAMTIAKGKIRNDLTDDRPVRLESKQVVLKAIAGDGSGDIILSTVNGVIEIE